MTAPRRPARQSRSAFLVPLLLVLAVPALGQAPELLADLGAQQSIWDMADVSGTLFFAGGLPTTGMELWKSDGTALGTSMVKDIWPGPNASEPRWFADLDGIALFQAHGEDIYQAAGLWRSSGAEAGTWQVSEVTIPCYLTPYAGLVYFNGGSPQGQELWVTNGQALGTYVVKDIWPGTTGSGPANFTVAGGVLFFTASDGANGVELWRTDGSELGTRMVRDIHPAGEASPGYLTAVGDTLFFVASDDTHGQELWMSDGTEDGTVLVKDIRPGGNSSGISWLEACNGLLYFGADDGVHGKELWKSDGTEAGTVMVKDINPYYGSSPQCLQAVGNTLFFQAIPSGGAQLMKSDGTEAGTVMVEYINPEGASYPTEITPYHGKAYFIADDGTHGQEPWVSDGTDTGTVMVQDIAPGSTGAMSGGMAFCVSGDKLYFKANVPDVEAKNHAQLWMLHTASSGVGDGLTGGAGVVLSPSRPNPFGASTSIRYEMAVPRPVILRILDVQGRVVRVLRDGAIESAGPHAVSWDGRDERGREVPSGVYLCRVRAGDEERTRPIVRMR